MRWTGVGAVLMVCWMALGCRVQFPQKSDSPKPRVSEKKQLQQRLAELEKHVEDLETRLAYAQGVGTELLDQVIHVDRIELGRFTRPWDSDNDGQTDGVIVYVIPKDAAGDAIKAAGSVHIRAFTFNHQAGPYSTMLPQWHFDSKTALTFWMSGLRSNYFKFTLPWPEGSVHDFADTFAVSVHFVETLTGREFEAEKQLTIEKK